MRRVDSANKDLVERARHLGFTFDLDKTTDTLTITIGGGAEETYTQGTGYLYADIELDTYQIVGFTILEFEAAFLKTGVGRQVFSEDIILPVLRRYGTFCFPPEREGTRIAATELRTLVPA